VDDHLPHLLLGWGLLVASALAARDAESFWNGLQSTSLPAFTDAASLNIEHKPWTDPARPPPASQSATI
jgi:hypothetical protein